MNTLGVVTLVSAVPFAILAFVPPIVVFTTGVLFVPASFGYLGRLVARERAALGLQPGA
jgi:hypothetical protein